MRFTSSLFAVLSSAALLAAPAAQAQSAEKAQPKAAASTAAKPAPKATTAADKATKVEGATAVRTAPSEMKKIAEKSYDGCGHGKVTAAADL